MAEQKSIEITDNPTDKPIPIETDFPIGGPTPEATIRVEGDTATSGKIRTDELLPVQNRIVGSENPDILYSTPEDDLVLAKGGDDTIFGSLGNDIYSGGDGFDTLDYTLLGKKITLLPQGLIGNGNTQGSQIQEIERIVGAPKKDNTIDGSGGKGPVFFTIDLSKNQLVVKDIPGLGSVEFVVENFVNVEGTENSDSIIGDGGKNKLSGNGGNDSLIGKLGNDTLIGGSGDDTLTGTDPGIQNPGIREKDVLTGGTGSNKFVLGDESGSYYDDLGNKDFAKITDFSFGDQIQLGDGEKYNVEQKKNGFNIFVVEDFGRDLISKVTLSTGIVKGISSEKSTSTNDGLMRSASSTSIATDSNTLLGEVSGDFTSITLDEQGIINLA